MVRPSTSPPRRQRAISRARMRRSTVQRATWNPCRPSSRHTLRGAGLRGIVGGRGDRQHRADRLDPELWRTHLRSISAVMPNFVATEPIAAPWESYSPLCSRTIRTARSLTSRGYLFCVFMTPSSQRLESPAKAGRFMHHPLPSVERDAVDPNSNGILRREEEGRDCEHSQTSEQNPATRLHSLVQRVPFLPIHDKPGPRSPR